MFRGLDVEIGDRGYTEHSTWSRDAALTIRGNIGCAGRGWITFEVADQRLHLADFANLRLDDFVR
jgi:hypothetical protein